MEKFVTHLARHSRLQSGRLGRYVTQCGLATTVVLVLLLVLDAFTQTVLIAALGASTFIAFAVPKSTNADPRHMIGGYVVGMLAGVLLALLIDSVQFASPSVEHAFVVISGAVATGLAMFLMVITRTEHPPAAALALGLVLNEWDLPTLAFIIGGIVVLTLVKQLILPLLMDIL